MNWWFSFCVFTIFPTSYTVQLSHDSENSVNKASAKRYLYVCWFPHETFRSCCYLVLHDSGSIRVKAGRFAEFRKHYFNCFQNFQSAALGCVSEIVFYDRWRIDFPRMEMSQSKQNELKSLFACWCWVERRFMKKSCNVWKDLFWSPFHAKHVYF